mmetsp:Transcript_83208/g.139058  ORF Transcript_83208/g.139058 Transcript_83208/m.139058 type:complete len:217 (+) Transcript_83208:1163-1813(+)
MALHGAYSPTNLWVILLKITRNTNVTLEHQQKSRLAPRVTMVSPNAHTKSASPRLPQPDWVEWPPAPHFGYALGAQAVPARSPIFTFFFLFLSLASLAVLCVSFGSPVLPAAVGSILHRSLPRDQHRAHKWMCAYGQSSTAERIGKEVHAYSKILKPLPSPCLVCSTFLCTCTSPGVHCAQACAVGQTLEPHLRVIPRTSNTLVVCMGGATHATLR